MSEEQQQPETEAKNSFGESLKALWNKPLKTSEKEIEKLRKKGKEIKQKTVGTEVISWALTILTAVVLALVIRTFLFEFYGVDGASMTNTLQNHEKMFCTKLDYLISGPQRGDVVICHYPGRGNTAFVKRLVGMPGDTVEMRDRRLYVNGKQIADPENMNIPPNYRFSEYKLQDDEYFVLGDNRGNSNDSHAIGPIPRSMIIAHVRQVIWPLNAIRPVKNEHTELVSPE